MKYSFLYLFGILLLIVNSIEAINPNTKYFIYNKVTSRCLKRKLTSNGYTQYYVTTYGDCTNVNDDDCLWYIRGNHIISAANENCLAVVNYNNLGSKNCNQPVTGAVYVQDFNFEDDTICTRLDNCLKDRNGAVGNKSNRDEYYDWTISTSLP